MKRDKSIRKQLHEVLDLVLDINGLQASNEECAPNHPTAFIDFMGHIGKIRICLFSDGWSSDKAPDISFESTIFDDFRFKLPALIEGLKKFTKPEVCEENEPVTAEE